MIEIAAAIGLVWGEREDRYSELRAARQASDAGERTFTYLLRAETPGNYRILPTSAELMYFPEVRGNGKPVRVKIADVPEE